MDASPFPTSEFAMTLPDNGGCSILLAGSTRSGKTTAAEHILRKHFGREYISILHTCSPHADIYKQFDVIQAPGYYPSVMSDQMWIQKNTNNKYKFLNILDDLVLGIKYDKALLSALTIGRNSHISVLQGIQAITLLNSASRTNYNFIGLFKLNADSEVERAVKSYLGTYFPADWNLAKKMKAYRELTEDHKFFWIDNLTGKVTLMKVNINK